MTFRHRREAASGSGRRGRRAPALSADTAPAGDRGILADGKWVAYASDESGRDEIYVQSFPVGGPKGRVSSAGGNFPRWRRDGLELYYLGAERKLMSVTVRRAGGGLGFGTPTPLFGLQTGVHSVAMGPYGYPYDVAPDGKRFLVLSPVGDVEAPAITVATGWEPVTGRR